MCRTIGSEMALTNDPRKVPNFHKIQHQSKFLAAFSACGSISRASRHAQLDRTTHYSWMETDPSYPARFKVAEARAARALEDEAVRRAHEGVRRPVLHKGKQVYIGGEPLHEVEYSDRLLMFLLEANNPDKFRRRSDMNVKFDPANLSEEDLKAWLDKAAREMCGGDPVAAQIAKRQALLAAGVEQSVIDAEFEMVEPAAEQKVDGHVNGKVNNGSGGDRGRI